MMARSTEQVVAARFAVIGTFLANGPVRWAR